jgi:hypothetical protein
MSTVKAGRALYSTGFEAATIQRSLRSTYNGVYSFSPPQTLAARRSHSTTARRFATPATPSTSYARKPTPAPYARTSTSTPSTVATNSPPTPAPAPDELAPITDLSNGLSDEPLILDEGQKQVDWTRSYHGLSAEPFSKEAAEILLAPIPFDDVEVKPDGIIYLPEIKYRRILNRAFGPGGWGLAPRGETIVTSKSITREYALVAHGRYVSTLSYSMDITDITYLDWFLSPVANKTTSLLKAYPPRPRAASRMR